MGAVALAAWIVSAAVAAQPATACVGGTPFGWAVTHSHGGLLRAIVVGAPHREDFTIDLRLSAQEALRGDPPRDDEIHSAIGAVCEQDVDAGEMVIVVFDVRGGEYPYPLPLIYVVDGDDALEPGVVAAALDALPASDSVASPNSIEAPRQLNLAPVLAGVLGLLVALGWHRRPKPSTQL